MPVPPAVIVVAGGIGGASYRTTPPICRGNYGCVENIYGRVIFTTRMALFSFVAESCTDRRVFSTYCIFPFIAFFHLCGSFCLSRGTECHYSDRRIHPSRGYAKRLAEGEGGRADTFEETSVPGCVHGQENSRITQQNQDRPFAGWKRCEKRGRCMPLRKR